MNPEKHVSGLIVQELSVAIVHIACRGGHDALSAAVSDVLGMPLPAGPRCTQAGPLRLLGIAPGRWLAMRAPADRDLKADLGQLLRDAATVCELSDAYVVWRLRGSGVRQMLARLVGVDLHERAFLEGDLAATLAAHTPVILWRMAAAGEAVFELAVPRSYSAAFLELLEESAAGAA